MLSFLLYRGITTEINVERLRFVSASSISALWQLSNEHIRGSMTESLTVNEVRLSVDER